MILTALVVLVIGVLVGLFVNSPVISIMEEYKVFALYLLLFVVGASVGMHKGILEEIKKYRFRIFVIPAGTIAGTLLGGVVCDYLIGYGMDSSMAIVSGLGWYSLAGVSIADLAGAEMGTVAFLSNVWREVIAFVLIPVLAKYLNVYTCIAPAGATSEDTTLPVIIKYTSPTVGILALFNGVVCSTVVPILIPLCYLF